MLIATDKKGNKAEIKYRPANERAEHWLITFSFVKGTAQTYWAMDEVKAKQMVQQVLGKVDWEVKDE